VTSPPVRDGVQIVEIETLDPSADYAFTEARWLPPAVENAAPAPL
jgi:hypothetical protein